MPGIAGMDAVFARACACPECAGADAAGIGIGIGISRIPVAGDMAFVPSPPWVPAMSMPDIESPFTASLSARQSPGAISRQGL